MKPTDFYTMIVPNGALEQVAQSYEGNWLADHGVAVDTFGDIDIVSVRVDTDGTLGLYRRLRKAANRIQDLYTDAIGVGMERNPTIDRWGQLYRMLIDYRGEPMGFDVVPPSSYAY